VNQISVSSANRTHVLLRVSIKDQVERSSEFAIYIVGSGRISVAGITRANIDPLCDAIAKVL
jgi:aspartate/tyrosine/aromatic aminotransferase